MVGVARIEFATPAMSTSAQPDDVRPERKHRKGGAAQPQSHQILSRRLQRAEHVPAIPTAGRRRGRDDHRRYRRGGAASAINGIEQGRVVIFLERFDLAVVKLEYLDIAALIFDRLVAPHCAGLNVDDAVRFGDYGVGVLAGDDLVDKPVEPAGHFVVDRVPERLDRIPARMDRDRAHGDVIADERGDDLRIVIDPQRIKMLLVLQVDREEIDDRVYVSPSNIVLRIDLGIDCHAFDDLCHTASLSDSQVRFSMMIVFGSG